MCVRGEGEGVRGSMIAMHAKLLGKVTRSMTGGRGVRGGEGVCERGGGGGERKHDRNAREAFGTQVILKGRLTLS